MIQCTNGEPLGYHQSTIGWLAKQEPLPPLPPLPPYHSLATVKLFHLAISIAFPQLIFPSLPSLAHTLSLILSIHPSIILSRDSGVERGWFRWAVNGPTDRPIIFIVAVIIVVIVVINIEITALILWCGVCRWNLRV